MHTPLIRRARRALVALVMVASLGLAGAAAASPAGATTRCATAGHAYLTQPGRVIFSGFEGDQRYGVPTVSYAQGTQFFNVGGNGIRPGTSIVFNVYNTDNWSFVAGTYSRSAGSNCVANEVGTSTFTNLPPGNYQVHAGYYAGNTGQYVVTDVVANLQVSPPPYQPPVDPDPCGGLPAYFCGYGG
jgi:hypothetical protein